MPRSPVVFRVARSLIALIVMLGLLAVGRAAFAQTSGALVVATDPPGIPVAIDGESVGVSPVRRTMMPGEHFVEATFPQGKTSRVVKIAAGESSVVNLTSPAATTPTAPTGTTAAPPAPTAPATTTPTPPPPPPTSPPTTPPPPPETEDALARTTASSHVNRIEGEIHSPTHSHFRFDTGYGIGLGLRCGGTPKTRVYGYADTNAGYDQLYSQDVDDAGCGLVIHLVPLDFFFGELTIDVVLGGEGSIGAYPGGDLGSPWFRLGPARTPVLMNIRLHVGGVLQQAGFTVKPGPGVPFGDSLSGVLVGGEAGPRIAVSVALTRVMSLDFGAEGGLQLLDAHSMNKDSFDPLTSKSTSTEVKLGLPWYVQFTGGIRL